MSTSTQNLQAEHWTDQPRNRDGVTIPRFWITVVLSLLIHGAAMWLWFPRTPLLIPGEAADADPGTALALRLVEPKRRPEPPVPPPAAREAPPPPPRARPQRIAPRPPPAPPVIAVETPEPRASVPAPSPPAIAPEPRPAEPPVPRVAVAPPPPVETDLSAYIASRRRARGEVTESTTPAQDENARRDRIVAANLASLQSSNFGNAPKNGGGTFQLQRVDYEYAEFTFFGWNKDVRRRIYQRIEVARGTNPDIQTAVIRKIIAIIREHEAADFRWESRRLGRDIALSARPSDNAELEAFMMKEFFTPMLQPR